MDKFFNSYDKEYMKMTMLKQEETFREQVCELHRLYHMQKRLMKDIAKTRLNTNNFASTSKKMNNHRDLNRQCLDLERPAEKLEEDGEEDEDELELTLGPTRNYRKRKDGDQTPMASDSAGRSFSSSSTGSSHIKFMTREEMLNNPRILGRRKTTSEVDEKLRQDLVNYPPWLMQVLSLNMT